MRRLIMTGATLALLLLSAFWSGAAIGTLIERRACHAVERLPWISC